MRVLLAGEHRLFLDAARRLLERNGFVVVGLASDGEAAVRLVRTAHPDVAILDAGMPKLSGLDAARMLLSTTSGTAVVLVTGSGDLGSVLEGWALGVRGFVVRTSAVKELFDAIRAAARGAIYVSPGYDQGVASVLPAVWTRRPRAITPREREVLRLVADGKTTRQIASILGLALKTVETHRARIMRKLDIHDIAGLVRYAIREQIVSA